MADKVILVVYYSQSGTMERLAKEFAEGASGIEGIRVNFKKAEDASLEDLLDCSGLAVCSPEYFGYMAGAVKDFFDRTYEAAKDNTFRLPYVIIVCAGNDGRGAIANIERIATGYKWKLVQEPIRIAGEPTDKDLEQIKETGQALAAGVEVGIF